MPLDSGAVTQISIQSAGAAESPLKVSPDFAAASDVGAMLRAAREFKGISLEDLAQLTRIRRAYLIALEELRLEGLPSRPFIIGYVRAYAQAVGLDPQDVVARFRQEAPEPAEQLRAPVGVSHERDPRLTLVAAAVAIVIGAVLVWNLAQHAMTKDDAPPASVPDVVAVAPAPRASVAGAPVVLSEAQPAPQESQLPAPYITPGLAPEPVPAAAGAAPAVETAAVVQPVRPAFNPKGSAYGAAPEQSVVTLQARKAASLVVRGSDGAVYFARQLAAGESYRAPLLKGLTVDVSDPAAFDVYANGELKGALPAPQTSIAKLEG